MRTWRHVLTTESGLHVEYVVVADAIRFRATLPDGEPHTFSEFREAIRFVVRVEGAGG